MSRKSFLGGRRGSSYMSAPFAPTPESLRSGGISCSWSRVRSDTWKSPLRGHLMFLEPRPLGHPEVSSQGASHALGAASARSPGSLRSGGISCSWRRVRSVTRKSPLRGHLMFLEPLVLEQLNHEKPGSCLCSFRVFHVWFLFDADDVIVQRLSAGGDFHFAVRVFFAQFFTECFCVFLADIFSVVDGDQFAFVVYQFLY